MKEESIQKLVEENGKIKIYHPKTHEEYENKAPMTITAHSD